MSLKEKFEEILSSYDKPWRYAKVNELLTAVCEERGHVTPKNEDIGICIHCEKPDPPLVEHKCARCNERWEGDEYKCPACGLRSDDDRTNCSHSNL